MPPADLGVWCCNRWASWLTISRSSKHSSRRRPHYQLSAHLVPDSSPRRDNSAIQVSLMMRHRGNVAAARSTRPFVVALGIFRMPEARRASKQARESLPTFIS